MSTNRQLSTSPYSFVMYRFAWRSDFGSRSIPLLAMVCGRIHEVNAVISRHVLK